jgi:hypothetical protein
VSFAACSADSRPDPDPEPTTPSVVNETGYLVADAVYYTAEGPLGDSPRDVAVLGAPGAVERVGGELSVNGGAPITVSNPGGAFVLNTSARLDDELELRYVLDGQRSQLTLQLDQLQSFSLQFGVDSGVAADGDPDWLVPGAEGGQVRVQRLDEPPYVVYNADRGLVVRVDDAGAIEIAAEEGDMICVAQLDEDSGAVTTSDCSPAP